MSTLSYWNDFPFSTRTVNAMVNESIHSIEHLCQHTEWELLRIPNFGRKSLNEIKEYLGMVGLGLRSDLPPGPMPAELSTLYAKMAGHMREVERLRKEIASREAGEEAG